MRVNRLALVLVFLWVAPLFGATPWEVAVLFVGAGESAEYQGDIDRALMELTS